MFKEDHDSEVEANLNVRIVLWIIAGVVAVWLGFWWIWT